MNARDTARGLLDEGICPIPVRHGSKKPMLEGWQSLTVDDVRVAFDKFFPVGVVLNIGVVLGASRIVDIDLDWQEARLLAPKFLPPTATFGRKSTPASHYVYRYEGEPTKLVQHSPPKSQRRAGKKPHVLEIRSAYCQTIFPGSVHESGELVTWDRDDDKALVTYMMQDIVKGANRLTAAAFLAAVWNDGHSRDELATALSGGLVGDGMALQDVQHLVAAVAEYANDEETKARAKKATRADQNINGDKGGAQPGWPTVARLLGEEAAAWLKKLLTGDLRTARQADSFSAAVELLNRRHAVVMASGRVCVMTEKEPDPFRGRYEIVLSHPADLRTLYANQMLIVESGKKVVKVNPVDAWLASESRREFKGIIFAPEQHIEGYFNLWRGFAVKPLTGNCELFLKHLRVVIAAGNEEHYLWMLAWLADAVQQPAKRPGVSIVLRGGQGTGKGSFVSYFGKLFGQHFLQVNSPRHLLGNFNAYLSDVSILFADEAFWAGDRAAEGVLKGLVTEDMLMIEFKGRDAFPVKNNIRLIAVSNHGWVVPAGLDERRFAVFDVSEDRKRDSGYFSALAAEMNNGGPEALLSFLLSYDYSGVDLRRIPSTAALMENKLRTADPIVRWWAAVLEAGAQIQENDEWQDCIIAGVLLDEFQKFMRNDRRYTSASDASAFGKELKYLCSGAKKSNKRINGKQHWCYCFPPLIDCIASFKAITGIEITCTESGAVREERRYAEY